VTQTHCDLVHGGRDFKGNELVRLLEHNFICAPSVIARREAWLAAAPVPLHLAFNDWYFTVMIAREYEFHYVAAVIADYRVHSTNHHARIVRERTEEPSVFWVLDRVFSTPEAATDLEAAKQAARGRIMAARYVDAADKYFQHGFDREARRCYLAAMGYRPGLLLRPDVLRRLTATWLPRPWYEAAKRRARRLVNGPL
jgi:hypothetical protein